MWGYLLESRVYNGDSAKHKFTGKERDEENLYDYFGARYYDSRIGRWGQVEPLIDKYPGISPYVYSLDNPLTLFDPNGLDVRAISHDAQQMIMNTLPFEVHGSVIFDSEGYLDKNSLNSVESSSGNLGALRQLVNDSRLFNVSIASEFSYQNESGSKLIQEFGPIENSFDITPFGTQTGEEGYLGQTLVPGNYIETFNSPDNAIYIIVNDALSMRGQANVFSHEAYGHAYLYSLGREHTHRIKNINGDFIETNEDLSNEIIRSITETEKHRIQE